MLLQLLYRNMLTFATQEKVLGQLLKKPSNSVCADCASSTPTWASLDFGVFLCCQCSGAHRALGPTITRVKSTKLDLWHQDWVENMKIGNNQLNAYWESALTCLNSKPKMGSNMNEVNRYVFDKYVKKRFVRETNKPDPLTAYKQQPKNQETIQSKFNGRNDCEKDLEINQKKHFSSIQPKNNQQHKNIKQNIQSFNTNQQPKTTSTNDKEAAQIAAKNSFEAQCVLSFSSITKTKPKKNKLSFQDQPIFQSPRGKEDQKKNQKEDLIDLERDHPEKNNNREYSNNLLLQQWHQSPPTKTYVRHNYNSVSNPQKINLAHSCQLGHKISSLFIDSQRRMPADTEKITLEVDHRLGKEQKPKKDTSWIDSWI